MATKWIKGVTGLAMRPTGRKNSHGYEVVDVEVYGLSSPNPVLRGLDGVEFKGWSHTQRADGFAEITTMVGGAKCRVRREAGRRTLLCENFKLDEE